MIKFNGFFLRTNNITYYLEKVLLYDSDIHYIIIQFSVMITIHRIPHHLIVIHLIIVTFIIVTTSGTGTSSDGITASSFSTICLSFHCSHR